MSDYEATPYDGHHTQGDSANSWRKNPAERVVGYGNWAGPGNRMDHEEADYIAQQRRLNPSYDPYVDPHMTNNPRYTATDPMDAAAFTHDHGYYKNLGADAGLMDMFTWNGLQSTREDDRTLVRSTQAAMATEGSRYSEDAQGFGKGLQGFFGSRVLGQDAVDLAGSKSGVAMQGLSGFVAGARNWTSAEEMASGIGQGIGNADAWLANTGQEAWQGVSGAARNIHGLGWQGALGAVGGFGNVAIAGGVHLGGQALDGARNLGGQAWDGARNLGGQAWDGARSVGGAAATGLSSAANTAGRAISNGASAVGGAVSSGASAVAGGAHRMWNWMTG